MPLLRRVWLCVSKARLRTWQSQPLAELQEFQPFVSRILPRHGRMRSIAIGLRRRVLHRQVKKPHGSDWQSHDPKSMRIGARLLLAFMRARAVFLPIDGHTDVIEHEGGGLQLAVSNVLRVDTPQNAIGVRDIFNWPNRRLAQALRR